MRVGNKESRTRGAIHHHQHPLIHHDSRRTSWLFAVTAWRASCLFFSASWAWTGMARPSCEESGTRLACVETSAVTFVGPTLRLAERSAHPPATCLRVPFSIHSRRHLSMDSGQHLFLGPPRRRPARTAVGKRLRFCLRLGETSLLMSRPASPVW